MRSLFRILSTVGVALAALVLSVAPAVAASPHVVKGPDVSLSGNTITVTASIAGLGNVAEATFNLSGTVEVFSRCYNHGGNKPQADNKQETVNVNSTGTFPVRNGRTNVSFELTAQSSLSCPGSQVVVIESIAWDLTLSGEGISIPIQG